MSIELSYVLKVILLIVSVRLMYKVLFMKSFSETGIIEKNDAYNLAIDMWGSLLAVVLGFLYLRGFIQFLDAWLFEPISKTEEFFFTVWIFVLTLVPIVSFFYFEKRSFKKKPLTRYASKQTDIPKPIVEFMLDVYLLQIRKEYYLKWYDYAEQATNEEVIYLDNLKERFDRKVFNSKIEYRFPLMFMLNNFTALLSEKNILSRPVVREYLIDNITFLTTIMTILNDEDLVDSLRNDLGFSELLDIVREFEEVTEGLITKIEFDKSEQRKFNDSKAAVKAIDGLHEVRSLRTFSKSVK